MPLCAAFARFVEVWQDPGYRAGEVDVAFMADMCDVCTQYHKCDVSLGVWEAWREAGRKVKGARSLTPPPLPPLL